MKMTLKALLFCLPIVACSLSAVAQTTVPQHRKHHAVQAVQADFDSPQDAVTGLTAAMRSSDRKLMREVLGAEADRYLHAKDLASDHEARSRFLAAYDEQSRIEIKDDAHAVLHVGKNDWPFPFPLVKNGARWHFDAQAGEQEWQDRRVGENELSAIQVALAYVDAQREYVLKDRNRDGLLEYAQKIVSSPGQHDGLYWPRADDEPVSPMGSAFAAADHTLHGVNRLGSKPYHGYFFRILTAQGKSAAGGAVDYMVQGRLIGGFALIAYPATYRGSGIKTFIVNHDGVVYSKDLGPHTAAAVKVIKCFDPDASWQKEVP